MSEINNGGPAFPVPGYNQPEGMTLRDYFAAQSIAGINPGRLCKDSEIQSIANQAYKLADAMLAARNEGGAA